MIEPGDALPFPPGPSAITPAWLTQALQHAGVLEDAAVSRVSLEPLGVGASFVGQVARLRPTYDRDAPAAPTSLIAKVHALDPDVRAFSKPMYAREVQFYQELAPHAGLPTPRCYLALHDGASGESLLLLEDLAPAHTVGECRAGCSRAEAAAALAHVARLHAAWWQSPRLVALDWMPEHLADPAAAADGYPALRARFLDRLGALCPGAVQVFAAALEARARAVFGRLADSPRTVTHGDFRPDNLAFGAAAGARPVVAFDWHTVRRGRPTFDVAWLLVTGLTAEGRRAWEGELLGVYHAALAERGVRGYPGERCREDYRLALVQVLYQLLLAGAYLAVDEAQRDWFGTILVRYAAVLDDHRLAKMLDG